MGILIIFIAHLDAEGHELEEAGEKHGCVSPVDHRHGRTTQTATDCEAVFCGGMARDA
jgi:hypothetical protein